MPGYVKRYNRRLKRPIRRRRKMYKKKTTIGRVPRSIYPTTHMFKRSITEVVELNTTTTPPTGWTIVDNAMTSNFVFALEQLTDSNDFSNLFRKYKIRGVKTQMYFTNSLPQNDGFGTTYPAATQRVPQLLMYYNVNQTGRVNGTLSEAYFLNTQTARKRTVIHDNKRPITLFHKVKQLSRVFGSAEPTANYDYALKTPSYISTADKTVEHYGFECRIQALHGGPFPSISSATPVSIKLIHTFYMSLQGVE